MTWAQVVIYAAGTAALLAAGGGLIKLIRALWVGAQRVTRLMDDLLGEPARPGVDARPGVLERLVALESVVRSLERRVASIERELQTNGGASLRDAVDKLAERVKLEAGGVGFQAERAFDAELPNPAERMGFAIRTR